MTMIPAMKANIFIWSHGNAPLCDHFPEGFLIVDMLTGIDVSIFEVSNFKDFWGSMLNIKCHISKFNIVGII